jgi:glutaredoxin-related protein
MLKIYGSMLCPDCVECRADLDQACVEYEFLEFADSLRNLKEFLKLRDEDPIFLPVKEKGSIGIPCIVKEDGSITLDWDEFLPM